MSIVKAQQYLNYVDEIYKKEGLTRLLETNGNAYKPVSSNIVLVNNVTLSGCYTYSRASGYAAGAVNNTWDSYTLEMDRGVKVQIDTMDSEEARIQAPYLASKWLRESLLPELDLYRFTKIKADFATNGGSVVEANLTYDTALDAIDTAVETMNDNEVPQNRVMFVSENMYKLMKQSGDFFNVRMSQQNNGIIGRDIETFDNMPLVRVPVGRFNTAATFGEGTNTLTGKAINFMIVDPNAVIAIIKHNVMRVITPEYNGDADGYIVQCRAYHGCSVLKNKNNGIYIHSKA